MRTLLVSLLAIIVVGCGGDSGAAEEYLKDLRKTMPSLNDVSDAALVSAAKDECRHPNRLTYTGFEGHGTTTEAEIDGIQTVARRHCAAFDKH